MLDARHYQRIAANGVFAVRLKGLKSWGRTPDYLYFGGNSEMRGYDYLQFIGHKGFFVDAELRFPLIDAMLTPLGVLGGLRGVFFADLGAAGFKGQTMTVYEHGASSIQPLLGYDIDSTGAATPRFGAPQALGGIRLIDGRASYGIGLESFIMGFPMHFDWSWKTLLNKTYEDAVFRTCTQTSATNVTCSPAGTSFRKMHVRLLDRLRLLAHGKRPVGGASPPRRPAPDPARRRVRPSCRPHRCLTPPVRRHVRPAPRSPRWSRSCCRTTRTRWASCWAATVMHLIDIAGAIAAHRHTRSPLVTAAVDGLQFLHPILVGDLIILYARVTGAFHTSLEVEVEVFSEGTLTGARRLTSVAYLTFVTVGTGGGRVEVPPLALETDDDRRRAREAEARRATRLASRRDRHD